MSGNTVLVSSLPPFYYLLSFWWERNVMEMSAPEEKVQLKKSVQPLPQWAWLPQDYCASVYIVLVRDPDAIFLRRIDFIDCFDKLVKDIQKYVISQKFDDDCKKLMEVGEICLGKPSGSDEWNRAIIRSKQADDMVELFFVDYGDTDIVRWSDVVPISNKLISQLPFQVIECFLAGVKFMPEESGNKEWEEDVVDMIYDLARNDDEEVLTLMVKVISVEGTGNFTGGHRYKVVLANCSVEPFVIINSKLVSSPFAELFEEEKLLESFEIIANTLEEKTEVSDCGEEIPSSSNLESEKYKEVEQFLKNLEEGDFDCSIFHSLENDADISDNMSESSVLSLPRPGGSLPRSSTSHLRFPPAETEDTLSSSSNMISSSQNSSTLSLNQDKNKSESLEEKGPSKALQVHKPMASSPSLSHHQSSISPDVSTSSLRITGIANNFRDLISPNLLGSPSQTSSSPPLNLVESVSPLLKRLSSHDFACDGLNDSEINNTLSEINQSFSSKTDKSGVENKSPCQKWVECVIPDSDEDLSMTVQDSFTNEQAKEKADLEIRTPMVEWHQDDNFVFILIKLPALVEYEFSSDITSVLFSAVYGGVSYRVELPELFGGHKSEKAQGIAKACYFEIKLEKLLKGKRRNWPRLLRSNEKFHWLKLNAEKACEDLAESDDEDVKRLACSLPLWNENPTDSISIASSERSELANSELSL